MSQLELLEQLDLLEDGYCIPRPQPNESLSDILPDEMLVLLKVLTIDEAELQQRKEKNKPPKPSLGGPEAQILLDAVQARLSQYATTIEQDLQTLQHLAPISGLDTSTRRHKMAIQVRVGEKEVLHQLSSMLATLVPNDAQATRKRSAETTLQGQHKRGKN